jgi:hypothetical protein
MTIDQIRSALRAANVFHRDTYDSDDKVAVFVDFADAPEDGSAKDKAVSALCKACKFDVADKGLIFLPSQG